MAQGGGQQQQSLTDGLKKVHSALADLKLSPQGMSGPGAQFIDAMMKAIQGFTMQQAQGTIGQQGQPGQRPGQPGQAPGGAPQMAGMAGMGMGPPSLPSMGAGGGPAGGPGSAVGLTPTPDSMDEISRMLSAGSVNP